MTFTGFVISSAYSLFDRMLAPIVEQDLSLFFVINQEWRNGFFNQLMLLVSYSVIFWSVVGVLLGLYIFKKLEYNWRKLFLFACILGCAVGTTDISTNYVKKILYRPRPMYAYLDVHMYDDGVWQQSTEELLVRKANSRNGSFYSAHAANSATVAAFLTGAVPCMSPLIYGIPLLVGYSRIYLGKHYPADVLCGWFAGLLLGKLYARAYRRTLAYKADVFLVKKI